MVLLTKDCQRPQQICAVSPHCAQLAEDRKNATSAKASVVSPAQKKVVYQGKITCTILYIHLFYTYFSLT